MWLLIMFGRIIPGLSFLDLLWVKQYLLGLSDRRVLLVRVRKTTWDVQALESFAYAEIAGARYSDRLARAYLYLTLQNGRRISLALEKGGSLRWQNTAAAEIAKAIHAVTEGAGRPAQPEAGGKWPSRSSK